jgi:hypothetical protein
MKEVFDKIKKNAEATVLRNNDGNPDFLLYLDHKTMEKGESLDIVTEEIKFDKPTHVVFVDDEPGKNFGHRCHYLLYEAKTGEFIRKVPAKFPYFMVQKPDTLELFRSCETTEQYKRKKKIRVKLEVAKLSAYTKLAPFPLKFWVRGRRYAILFSGASNGRHVNDLEFLYRTLVDVYGYDTADIYVLNYDGTINYNQAVWSSGWTEPPASSGFGPDGSAWRMVVNGQGNRAGFQSVINNLKSRIRPWDCLLIHTNNHGWYDTAGGYLSAYGSPPNNKFYASDFAADLATLPQLKTLLVVMEQCASGSFATPILSKSPATKTVFEAAVPGDESSAGGWPFDPWAEMWISAMAGVRGDGSPLAVSPDDDLDTRISAWEAYDFALSIDDPVMSESSAGLSHNVYLCRCLTTVKPVKEWKELKEYKEWKEVKEPKEYLEPKQVFEPKRVTEPKQVMDPKQAMEPKQAFEGPELPVIFEQYRSAYAELDERIGTLEEAVDKLTPFIRSEERPELKPKPRGKG